MPYHIEPHLIIEGTFYTLLIFSVLTWTLILFKLWQFGKNSYYNRRFNKAFWDAPDLATANKNSQQRFYLAGRQPAVIRQTP
jgi:biopolymer transport protein ExbB